MLAVGGTGVITERVYTVTNKSRLSLFYVDRQNGISNLAPPARARYGDKPKTKDRTAPQRNLISAQH